MAREERIRQKMIFFSCGVILLTAFFLYGARDPFFITFICAAVAAFLGFAYLMLKKYEPVDEVRK